MPRQPIDYSKALIYKLCCKDTSIKETYIGSTTDFRHRKSCHKTACNNPTNKDHNNPKYKFIREHGGWENWDMVLVAYAPCKTKLELLKIEREYIEKQEQSLNIDIPTRTRSEYYFDNREVKAEKAAEYRAAHKEEAAEYNVEYRKANREKLAAYIAGYQAANRDKLREYNFAYREANRDELSEKKRAYRERKIAEDPNYLEKRREASRACRARKKAEKAAANEANLHQ